MSAHSTATPPQDKAQGHQAPESSDFVPIALDQVLVKAMAGLPVYLERDQDGVKRYNLHCGESARFSDFHRRRLQERSIRSVFVPRLHHGTYRERVETELESLAADSAVPPAARAGLICEMAAELLHEWMEGESGNRLERLGTVARAACAFITSQRLAFAHLYACARHDDAFATHMTNVGLWMACLTYATGVEDHESLHDACLSGFLHDTGMRSLPKKMLAKAEPLTSEERGQLRSHPTSGADYLKTHGVTDDTLLRVAFEHHERLDGSGYPAALKKDQIHPLAQLCAVIDSFEAMTSTRRYKPRVLTLAEATAALQAEPAKYDPALVEAWISLLKQASEQGTIHEAVDQKGAKQGAGRRVHQRFSVECAMQLRVLTDNAGAWVEGQPLPGKVRNLSRSGIGIELKDGINPGTYVRVSLKGKGSMQDKTLDGIIVRSRPCKSGHDIGIRFCTPGK